MRGLAALLVTVALAAGCGSYRRIAVLDDAERAEFEMLRARLAGLPVRVAAGPSGNECSVRDVEGALAFLGMTVGAPDDIRTPGATTVEVDGPFGVREPLVWTLLTLGIVPDVTDGEFEYQFRVIRPDAVETTSTCAMSTPAVVGWLGLPLALLPGWTVIALAPGDTDHVRKRDRLALSLGRALGAAPPK